MNLDKKELDKNANEYLDCNIQLKWTTSKNILDANKQDVIKGYTYEKLLSKKYKIVRKGNKVIVRDNQSTAYLQITYKNEIFWDEECADDTDYDHEGYLDQTKMIECKVKHYNYYTEFEAPDRQDYLKFRARLPNFTDHLQIIRDCLSLEKKGMSQQLLWTYIKNNKPTLIVKTYNLTEASNWLNMFQIGTKEVLDSSFEVNYDKNIPPFNVKDLADLKNLPYYILFGVTKEKEKINLFIEPNTSIKKTSAATIGFYFKPITKSITNFVFDSNAFELLELSEVREILGDIKDYLIKM